MTEPLEPIVLHQYYACSWPINHHGLNVLADLLDVADDLGVTLRARRPFTHEGYILYPIAARVPDPATLRAFIDAAARGAGMEDWYIVNIAYFDKGMDFAANVRAALASLPQWEQAMRQYADHNAAMHADGKPLPGTPATPPEDAGD